MNKTCTKCLKEKPLSNFAKMAASKDGYAWQCKGCASAYGRERRKEPEFKRRKRHNSFKFAFGIGIEEYERLFDKQGGICAICFKPETKIHPSTGLVQFLSVDHCHNTGRVRGLLCSQCNLMLGLANDSPEILEAALRYLGGE